MPPRKSTRSTRASVEPAAAATKRKRTQREEDPTDESAAEEGGSSVELPKKGRASRAGSRSRTASGSKARASTRKAVADIAEEESESDAPVDPESPPPPKKPRKSLEASDVDGGEDDGDDNDVEATPVPRRGRRAPPPRTSAAAGARKTKTSNKKAKAEDIPESNDEGDQDYDGEDDDFAEATPVRRASGSRAKKAPAVSKAKTKAAPKAAAKSKSTTKAPTFSQVESDLDSDLGEEDSQVRRSPTKKTASQPLAGSQPGSPSKRTAKVEETDDEGREKDSDAEDDEAEHSLLEPPKPPPVVLPPPVPEEPQGPKSRLVIHKMALINFKSYAGRQEIGPFHKSFSAIVGPNGSGKSNTIDALLFVFGYRASKMRQAKLSELIHNSARFPDLDECSVEVHFREIIDLPSRESYEIVPDSNLVVARTAYKNNSSKYTINGRSSNFTEVQTLLKGRGIDLDHKRFLILQGEVESIAQMKPKAPSEHEDGLLEYLEDIIGTSRYKEPIESTLVEVDKHNEDRAEKLNRLRIIEREKEALEEKKREAEDYLRLQNEHVRAQSRLWQFYIWKCLDNEEKYGKQQEALTKELADETTRNKDDIVHCEMLERHYSEREAAYEEVKAAAEEAKKELAAHEKQQVGFEERRKHASAKAKKLKKTLQDDEKLRTEASRTIEDNTKKADKEKRKVDEHETELSREEKVLETIQDSLKDKTQVFHDQIEAKQKELAPWIERINAKRAKIDVATGERDDLAKKAEAVQASIQEAQENLVKLETEQKSKVETQNELKADRAALGKDVKKAEAALEDATNRVQGLRAKASSSRQKVEEAKASQAANTSNNRVLDGLNGLKATGRISGFHGRLGSLGTIPDKYDVAVTTASPSLNNMVVDTVDQGQACIEYLRSQNVGRASFIVLEKLPNQNLEKMTTPENVPRLFDLIKPKEPRFAPAFFKAVGNTLVADDLEQANRIAFGGQGRRWRVVTLAGQLIDSSGTMSGGGTSVSKGGMSSKLAAETVQPALMRKYEQECEQDAQLLEETIEELRQCEADLDVLKKKGPQIDMALQKVELDIQAGMKRLTEAQKRVRDLKSQSKPDAGDVARIQELDREIATLTRELEDLQKKSSAIEKVIKELEQKILDIGGSKLMAQKSKVDGIKTYIQLANDELTKAEVAIEKAKKDIKKLDGTIDTNTATLEDVQAEIEELDGQLSEVNEFVDTIREKVKEAQTSVDHQKDDLDELKAQLEEKQEGIQAFRQKEMELQQQLADLKKATDENNARLVHWQSQHDALQLEDLDESDDEGEYGAEKDATEVGSMVDVMDEDEKPEVKTEEVQKLPRQNSHELHMYSAEELSRMKQKELIAEEQLLDEKVKGAKPNMQALKDYRKREQQFLAKAKELDDITRTRDEYKAKYDGLRKQRLDEFMAGFGLISSKLKEMYQMITLGGNAELELVDSMDPFSEGIIFSVMPPKKSWKNISNLSGGEKTLSSLALVFALHVFKPTPLYFMDEIDAALDFRNVSIVANYIKDRTKNAQFIIISLRNDMFELSHRLIGIYKTSNATRSIAIDNHALTNIPTNTIPVATS